MQYGKETIQLFEIDQPLCPLVYGDAPCTAALGTTGTQKCFNTRSTCQDPDNYRQVSGSPDTPNVLTLRFARDQDGILQYGPLIPSMIDIETTPGSINLAAMDRDASAMGQRESVAVQFIDHKHSDNLVDPYRLERVTGDASILETGTAQGGGTSTITLAADSTDEIDPGMKMLLDDTRLGAITAYDKPTKTVTVASPWPSNMVINSNTFDTLAGQVGVSLGWLATSTSIVTVASSAELDPNGGLTAYKLTAVAGNNAHQLGSITALGGGNPDPYVSGDIVKNTIYVKQGTAPFAFIKVTNTGTNKWLWFEFASETITYDGGTLVSSLVTAVDNGWYKIDWTVTGLLRYDPYIGPAMASATTSFNAAGTESLHIWRMHQRISG